MRKIKIFIGSSIVEFKNERQDLENFIHNLSNDFIDKYEIMIIPFTCEATDNAMAITRKQDEYNKQIEESEMCFFLFYTRAGEYTIEELNYAYNVFKNSEQKKHKVYVYFKIVPETVNADDSIENLKQILEKRYGHFFSTFENLDTVKLRILLNLKFQEMNFIQVGMGSGKLQVNGSPINALDNMDCEQDLAVCYYNLSNVYLELGQSEKSEEASKKASILLHFGNVNL